MDQLAWHTCNALVCKLGTQKKSRLLSYLPPHEKQLLGALPATDANPFLASDDPEELLARLHSSWLIPLIRSVSQEDAILYIAALPSSVAMKIQKELLVKKALPQLTFIGQNYLKTLLVHYITKECREFLPRAYLPHSPLNTLLELSTEQLKAVIEFLGLHDLALEMKQIIDTGKIKKILSALSHEARRYLDFLQNKKEAVIFKKLNLNSWDGKEETLQKALTQRGVNRLAKALHPQSPMLLWHISRMLSYEDASLLQSLCKPLEHSRAASLLSQQIIEVIPLTKKLTTSQRL